MILTERHIIKKGDKRYNVIDNIAFLSKNLYNSALYLCRQYYYNTGKTLNYYDLDRIFKSYNQKDYRVLPSKVAQQTLKMVDKNYKSFFKLVTHKNPNINKTARIPKFLDKIKGRYLVIYTNQAISKTKLKEFIIKPSGLGIEIKTKQKVIQQVRLIPRNNHYIVEVLYKFNELEEKPCNGRFASIDLGVNNLVTLGSNVERPIIINGKPIKSINRKFNKDIAKYKSNLDICKNGVKHSKRMCSITNKRNNKINDYLHKTSHFIVNHLVDNDINTLVIGKNDGWKQDTKLGKRNNQNFVQIPHTRLIEMLQYKCKMNGITVKLTEESYTSKCSFIDNEPMEFRLNYMGKRVKRGLFLTKYGKIINADLNGALNILRKVIGEFQYPIEVCSTPVKLVV